MARKGSATKVFENKRHDGQPANGDPLAGNYGGLSFPRTWREGIRGDVRGIFGGGGQACPGEVLLASKPDEFAQMGLVEVRPSQALGESRVLVGPLGHRIPWATTKPPDCLFDLAGAVNDELVGAEFAQSHGTAGV